MKINNNNNGIFYDKMDFLKKLYKQTRKQKIEGGKEKGGAKD